MECYRFLAARPCVVTTYVRLHSAKPHASHYPQHDLVATYQPRSLDAVPTRHMMVRAPSASSCMNQITFREDALTDGVRVSMMSQHMIIILLSFGKVMIRLKGRTPTYARRPRIEWLAYVVLPPSQNTPSVTQRLFI